MFFFFLGSSNGLPVKIKEEPADIVDTEERCIVLEIGNHLVDHEATSSVVDPYEFQAEHEHNVSRFASPSYDADTDSRLGSNGSDRFVNYNLTNIFTRPRGQLLDRFCVAITPEPPSPLKY